MWDCHDASLIARQQQVTYRAQLNVLDPDKELQALLLLRAGWQFVVCMCNSPATDLVLQTASMQQLPMQAYCCVSPVSA